MHIKTNMCEDSPRVHRCADKWCVSDGHEHSTKCWVEHCVHLLVTPSQPVLNQAPPSVRATTRVVPCKQRTARTEGEIEYLVGGCQMRQALNQQKVHVPHNALSTHVKYCACDSAVMERGHAVHPM